MSTGAALLRRVWTPWILAGVLLPGCAMVQEQPSPTSPFFNAEPGVADRYQALAQDRERRLTTCADAYTCARLHYSRALIALFESRQMASTHFERVTDYAPESSIANSSQAWIRLIDNGYHSSGWDDFVRTTSGTPREDELVAESTQQVVRDLLEREIRIYQLWKRQKQNKAALSALQAELAKREKEITRLTNEQQARDARVPSVEQLQREVEIREEKIAELHEQLEALKLIDKELRHKTRPSKPIPLPKGEKQRNVRK